MTSTQRPQLSLFSEPRKQIPTTASCRHKIVGLFAGIGGLERGLHRVGHETLLLCENDDAAQAVLTKRFPATTVHGDIRSLKELPCGATLVAAGFPCQDLSQAGRANGIGGARSALVGEVFRLLKKHRTPWVLLENVPFMLQLERGGAMDFVTRTLEALGYRWAYRVVDSRAFGLPQRRRRVYLVASLEGDPRAVLFADQAAHSNERVLNGEAVACGFYWTEGVRGLGWAVDAIPTLKGGSTIGIPSPPAILLPSGLVVKPDIRDAERLQGFPANWTRPAEQVARTGVRWKLVGNAVSVAAAAWIGRRMASPGEILDFNLRHLTESKWPTAAWNVGDGRVAAGASEWPVKMRYKGLEQFLKFPPTALSARATQGFLHRTVRSSLRFPEGFLRAIEAHLRRVSAAEPQSCSSTLVPDLPGPTLSA